MMHAANTVTYVVANDDASFYEELKGQPGMACYAVSKQEG
jgi:hypothetical protein